MKVTLTRDNEQIQLEGQTPIILQPESYNVFSISFLNSKVRFEKNDDDVFTKLIIEQDGISTVAEKND